MFVTHLRGMAAAIGAGSRRAAGESWPDEETATRRDRPRSGGPRLRRVVPGLLALLTLSALPAAAQAQAVIYRVTFEGKFTASALASGVSVPPGEHFTTLIGAVHNDSVTFWSSGGTASAGIEAVAELGTTDTFTAEINAALLNALAVIEQSIASGGTATATVDITLTTAHPLVTLTSMVAPSPDWFVGVAGLSLRTPADDGWQPSRTVDLFPYDAGTEEGTEFSLTNAATSPQGIITSIKGTGKFSNQPIATLTFDLQLPAAPEITSLGPFAVAEGATAVATLTASDDDTASGQLTWTIPSGTDGGADADKFMLGSTGVLTFTTAPDYEAPTDTKTDNVYEVTVQVSDGSNTDTADLEVTVTNVAEGVPNIVIILADDLGYGDVAHLNSQSQIPTPNLDALAQAGMTFLDAHTPSSVCTPTRYGLLTGRYAWRTRLKKWVLNGYGEPLLASGRATLGSLLQAAGYRTAAIGKWHLGLGGLRENGSLQETVTDGPHTHGFDESYILPASLDYPPYVYIRDGEVTGFPLEQQEALSIPRFMRAGEKGSNFDPAGVLDELIGEAEEFIAQQAADRQPFLLYLPLTAPHKPVWPAERFEDETELGPYGDFIVQVDAAVGEVMDALEDAEVADDTLLIFTSDNGSFMYRRDGPSDMDHTDDSTIMAYRPASHTPNHVYRGTKADIWEAGHRVPFFARWPGEITPGSTQEEVISLTDVFATVAEIVEHELSENEAEDSFSFLPLLRGNAWTRPRAAVIHHSARGMFAIRDGDWKLVAGNGSGGRETPKGSPFQRPYQLFDLASDLSEQDNVYDQHPLVAQRLERELECIRDKGRSRLSPDEKGVLTLNLTPLDSISESGAESSTVTATLSPAPSLTRTVTVAAPAGDVILSQNRTLTIAAGATDSTGEVTLTARDNAVDEPETRAVTVSGTADDVCVAGPVTVPLTIRDNDNPPTLARLELGADRIKESGETTTVTAYLSNPSSEVTVVGLTVPVGVEVVALSTNELTIPAGDESGTVTVTGRDNEDYGSHRTVTLRGQVTTPASRVRRDVTLTVMDNDDPVVEGENAPTVTEGETMVAEYTVADPAGVGLVWAVDATSADAAAFAIDASGRLRFQTAPDYETQDSYSVMVEATDQSRPDVSLTGSLPVTVTVADAPGRVALPSPAPQTGTAFPATLTDPDGVDVITAWCWERSLYRAFPLADPSTRQIACDAQTAGTYTPVTADRDHYLRVTATYTDGGGTPHKAALGVSEGLVSTGGGGGGRPDPEPDPEPEPAPEPVGVLENPGPASFQSGLGLLSGWVCEAEVVELEINGTQRVAAAYGTDRADTAETEDGAELCGDTDNGFGLLFNWNLLGDGVHTVQALADGVAFDQATFTVTTLGEEFLEDAVGETVLADFPTAGEAVRLVWQPATQNFVLAPLERGSPPASPPGPTQEGPLGTLENPGPASFQSGLGLLSGWVCEAEVVELEINGTQRVAAAYGTDRADTAETEDGAELCGDTDNGFGLLFNWNLLLLDADPPRDTGVFTARALADGVEFGRATFTVTTLEPSVFRLKHSPHGRRNDCIRRAGSGPGGTRSAATLPRRCVRRRAGGTL